MVGNQFTPLWVLKGHKKKLRCVIGLSDGTLASVGYDQTVRLWNLKTGKSIAILGGKHTGGINSVADLGNGRIVTGSRDNSVVIWNIANSSVEHVFTEHHADVNCVKVLPNGHIVSCSDDKTIRIWNPSAQQPVLVLKGHQNFVAAIAVSSDGKLIASKSMDGTLRIWETASGECKQIVEESLASGVFPVGIAFHPSKPLLASLDEQGTHIRVWNVTDLKPGQSCPTCAWNIESWQLNDTEVLERGYIVCGKCACRVYFDINHIIPEIGIKLQQPQRGLIYRLFIASPSDCQKERRIIKEEVVKWNESHSRRLAAVLLPMAWEQLAPNAAEEPQALINELAVNCSQIVIGVFRHRFGTPTANANSGAVEEIEHFVATQRPTLVYFLRDDPKLSSIDLEQYNKVLNYRNQLQQNNRMFGQFTDIGDFRQKVREGIEQHMERMINRHR
ncbi:MAG: WD40 repeat domain-containing protein [Planctomycetota bacterium]